LTEQLHLVPEIKRTPYRDEEPFEKWKAKTRMIIANIFGQESAYVKEFNDVRFFPPVAHSGTTDSELLDFRVDGLAQCGAKLEAMISEIEQFWPETPVPEAKPSHPKAHQVEKLSIIFERFPSGIERDLSGQKVKLEVHCLIRPK
jgi:hypothetical protein